jgi:hypothetical protein
MTRWVKLGFALLVLGSSGTYFFVYIYRWEWNRAATAAAIFVMMEVAIFGMAILDRLKKIEDKVAATSKVPDAIALEHLRATAPEPKPRFRWLTGGGDQMSVFVPVLMGAGFVVSGIAWAVERVSHATARPLLERGLAVRMNALALPAGGLMGNSVAVPLPERSGRGKRLAAMLAVTIALSVGADVLGDRTQTRPDVVPAGLITDVALQIKTKGFKDSAIVGAQSLWAICRSTVPYGTRATGFSDLGGGRVAFSLSTGLGHHSERQFIGCMEDATLDNVQGDVVGLHSAPK